ncbi:MAG: Lrp/AsnC family transcriptional regulator [Candidatus Woesearchaeota archaeon]|nr:Lrp/AsnC family transcriptional regulator [Candidatus Woesearchaeota archaeon]
MDKKDEKILNILKENCKLSTQQISKKTLIPITTIYNRIKKLEKKGIIKKYTLSLDYKKIGKPILAYILVTVDYKILKRINKTQHDLTSIIKREEAVEEAVRLTGVVDIMVKVRVKSIDELDAFITKYIRNIEGVEKTETMIVLGEV